jgi:membrane-associated phospholipid phosphatase
MLARSALAAFAFTLLSILAFDGPVATALSSLPADARNAINQGVLMCEWLFGFRVSPYLYGGLLILAGILANAWKNRTIAQYLLFIGLSHVTARFLAGIMKPPFSRLRPFEALGDQGWHDTWFAAAGNSFPSGHAAHFWSLFFPLAVLFPRFRIPLAVLPVLISGARVVVNHHYLSDVVASLALAAVVTWAYAEKILKRNPAALPASIARAGS